MRNRIGRRKDSKVSEETAAPVKLNIGSGPNPMEGFVSVDTIKFNDDIQVWDAGKDIWPHENESVDEVHCSHMIEHLTAPERIHFINELHRVLKPKAKATIIAPHWASCRAYGDLTHQWPPVSEFWFYYLSKEWRAVNAPHSTYSDNVDFDCTWGYGMNQAILTRNPEFQQYAMANFKEAITDIYATLVKK
jgi:SAM-dependent methyltransferase